MRVSIQLGRGEETGVFVSIIIPTYNERTNIEELLLRVQAVPLEKEVLVIDDGSTDDTRALLQGFEKAQAAGHPEIPVQNGGDSSPTSGFFFRTATSGKARPCAGVLKLRPAMSF